MGQHGAAQNGTGHKENPIPPTNHLALKSNSDPSFPNLHTR